MTKSQLEAQLIEISQQTFTDEQHHIKTLLDYINISEQDLGQIEKKAINYVEHIKHSKQSAIEGFIQEFSLSNEEGIAIICLSEALLRIPDNKTAMELLEDKLKGKDWKSHFKRNSSLFVKASALGLLLTGSVVDLADSSFSVNKLVAKLGMPVILKAMKQAIKLLSDEYILGSDLKSALKNAASIEKLGCTVSFDILGESSRTSKQADFYYQAYISAIKVIEQSSKKNAPIHQNHNLSVKLTALHPRVNYKKISQLRTELMPKLKHIISLCRDANIAISFDAEESYRQDTYLQILTDLILDPEFANYDGIGFVIQAYQKRTFYTIDYIASLAKSTNKKIPVRLVKGAYWDSEIKFAQEFGLEAYPVFTRKEYTDTSYIACAQKILSHSQWIYPQFATHNAHTIATIEKLAAGKDFEFQRLQGMGAALHNKALSEGNRSRIYAPVGHYEDLLAYLMRRLLENGANSSFVNMLSDPGLKISDAVANPLKAAQRSIESLNKIPAPSKVYGDLRSNSVGFDMGYLPQFTEFSNELKIRANNKYEAHSIIDGKPVISKTSRESLQPADHSRNLGDVFYATDADLKNALDNANTAFPEWSATNVSTRASILRKFGQLLHTHRFDFYSLLIREGGKNIEDAISELREAIDFAEYYASMAERYCGTPYELPCYTGEHNTLSWHPKGIFVCISPWNFPLAIFVGQVLAALVTGNVVLAKPADNTSLIATLAFKLIHEAGVHNKAAQLLIARGKQVSNVILSDPRIMGVCFTGSTEVAHSINRLLAGRNSAIATFIAETGGQNCMIVDSSALLEQAADSIIHSAFGSIGQRCSALRVAYIQDEIYEPMQELLVGYMNELSIGNPENLSVDLGPVIDNASKADLLSHIKQISKANGCSLIASHKATTDKSLDNGSFVAPHIIEISHISDLKKENFGPILHLRRFKSSQLDAAITEVNSTNFGLTFGIQTRIESKIHSIANKISAGNIYANRTIIGAQVGTHPFGGENNSGTGFKAGGPNYLSKFMNERALIINTTAIGGNLELLKTAS